VFHLYLAYGGDTQIELIQPVSGASMFDEFLRSRGDGVQHVAYCIDETEYDVPARRLAQRIRNGAVLVEAINRFRDVESGSQCAQAHNVIAESCGVSGEANRLRVAGQGEHGWEVQLLRDGDWLYGRRWTLLAGADEPQRGLEHDG
jgi:hypothetical protein